jgi:hypothetical protein
MTFTGRLPCSRCNSSSSLPSALFSTTTLSSAELASQQHFSYYTQQITTSFPLCILDQATFFPDALFQAVTPFFPSLLKSGLSITSAIAAPSVIQLRRCEVEVFQD